MRSERVLAGALLLAGGVTACDIETVAIPNGPSQLALHAVLSATAGRQRFLLERTWNGSVPSYELGNPLLQPAYAEKSAVVRLMTPDGQTLVGLEESDDPANKGRGDGFYRFELPGGLQPGGTYQLFVTTADGSEMSAHTTVPFANAAFSARSMDFDRSGDTLSVTWPVVPGAQSYLVRVETPYGPNTFFTDSNAVRLPGDLRNVDVTSLPHVFIPGFPQAVTVSAVDRNFYDWFRTRNTQTSGRGEISSVEGGIGVFGSLVRLHFDSLDVSAPQEDPEEGAFVFNGSLLEASVTPNLEIVLYVESRSLRGDQPDAISGRYQRRPFLGMEGCVTCGLLGTVRDGHVVLAMLRDWLANDTADVFTGDIHGDTLVGSYRRSGFSARFVRP